MADDTDVLELMQRQPHLAARGLKDKARGDESEEASCAAFGYQRGLQNHALRLEFRFRTGEILSFPYSWLGPVQFNPSVGLLLQFSGDVLYAVLIHGSNLDAKIKDRSVNLTDRGIERQRILWIREMEEAELQAAGDQGPTIDRIEVAKFESQHELGEWLREVAPGFALASNRG